MVLSTNRKVTLAAIWVTAAVVAFYFWGLAAAALITIVVSLITVVLYTEKQSNSEIKPEENRDNKHIASLIADEMNSSAVSSAEVSFATDHLKERVGNQLQSVEHISDTTKEIADTVTLTSSSALQTLTASKDMHETSRLGLAELHSAVQNMQQITTYTTASVEQISSLDAQVTRIQSVTKVIEDIASQTNLLALNAAIEAARAGESGRGFAVVADEVRVLAKRTAQSTDEVTQIVSQILAETHEVTDTIQTLSNRVDQGASSVESVEKRLGVIASQAQQVEQQVSSISSGASENEKGLLAISGSIINIQQTLAETDHELQHLQSQSRHLMEMAEHSNAVLVEHYEQSTHSEIYKMASNLALSISKQFEDGISAGQITENELFDRHHRATSTPGSDTPTKYHTKYDSYCDKVLPAMQEPVVEQRNEIIYAIATDDKGYVPTHNNQFCQPLTGDADVDILQNRTKRIFDDRVGLRCGKHTKTMLLQTYKRDTGEVVHDLSVPIYVNGRHWGGVRIGYHPIQSDNA